MTAADRGGDDSPAFQRRCLELMTAAVEAGEASASDLAFLIDRVATHQGRPQTYGTQQEWRGDTCVPMTIEDPEHVDARRREAGLGPLAENTAAINAAHQPQHNAIDLYDRDAVDELARYIRDMLLSKDAA